MLRLKKNQRITHSAIYLGLLLAMAASLPLSKALMSIIPGCLMLNWLIEGQFSLKLERLKERKSVVLLISIFFVYLIGLLWTNNLKWGLHDVKIQLPLLVLPLVIGTSHGLNYTQLKRTVYVFSAAVVVASLCSIWVLLGFSGKTIQDPRDMSLFISHIRFALLINISIFSLGWYFLNQEKRGLPEKVFLLVVMLWLSIFLLVLKSVTGWVVFLIVLSVVAGLGVFQIKKLILRVIFTALIASIYLAPAIYIGYVVKQFYSVEALPATILTEKTSRGNPYSHDFSNRELENGHYTFLYMNANELREVWNKRSTINYDSTSASGFNTYVLLRYLTSKGYRKDAEGLEKLTADDIRNIEQGMTNYRFAGTSPVFKRIYQIVWEADVYRKGGNPSGHSVTQRLEYYKMAGSIIRDNFWLGNGTGGYYTAYQEKYNQNKFFQAKDYRQRSHNMFLSYWIDFGLIGLVYICFALVAPIFMERKIRSFLLMIFLLIVFISFLNEDSLNNHDAITFFSFFYPLYLYSLSPGKLTASLESDQVFE
jgi:O-antigen ligase